MYYKLSSLVKFRCYFLLIVLFCLGKNVFCQPVLTLNDAIKQALTNNFDIQIEKNNEQITQIQNNWGNAGALPTVRATGAFNISSSYVNQKLNNGTVIQRNGASLKSESAAITGQWFLFNGFRVVAAKKRLELQAQNGTIQVKQQANLTAYDVLSAYLNLLRLTRQYKATLENMSLFEERMKLSENRLNIGVGIRSDFLQAEIDYNQQKNVVIGIENDMANAKANINNLLSRNPDTEFLINDSLPMVQLPDRLTTVGSLDTVSLALLIAKNNEWIITQQYREINAQRMPSLSLNAGGNFNNSTNSAGQFLKNLNYGPNAGVMLSIPIFQGSAVKNQLRVNEIRLKNQQIQYNQLKMNLQTAISNAYNSYENAKRQYELETKNLALVKENSQIAMERFRKASITTVELRQTQLNIVDSQTRMINAGYQMKQAEADIMLAIGQLVE